MCQKCPTRFTCSGAVGQQGLLPKPTDSRLWLLEVRPGQERRLVVSLMAKACKQTLFIKSAFMQDHLAVRVLAYCPLLLHAFRVFRCPYKSIFCRPSHTQGCWSLSFHSKEHVRGCLCVCVHSDRWLLTWHACRAVMPLDAL